MALDFVTLVEESIVDGNDNRCLLALPDELVRLLANGIVLQEEKELTCSVMLAVVFRLLVFCSHDADFFVRCFDLNLTEIDKIPISKNVR